MSKRKKDFYTHESLYESGFAIGFEDIKADSMIFEFWDEEFKFPTMVVFPITTFNGFWYTAPIKKLRALAEKN